MKRMILAFVLAAGLFGSTAHAVIISDIAMMVDESGSMSDVQANLRNNIGTFANIMQSGGVDVRFALVGYGSRSVAPRLLTDFTSAAGFATAAQNLVINGFTEPGYTATAFALNALDAQSPTLSYRANALKNLIIFTDEPSNGDTTSRGAVGGSAVSLTIADQLLTDNNALFNAVLRSSALNTPGYPTLATGHGGNVYDLNGLNTSDQTVVSTFVQNFAAGKLQETLDFCQLNPNDPACIGGSSSIPEPATIALLGLGLMGIGAARRRAA